MCLGTAVKRSGGKIALHSDLWEGATSVFEKLRKIFRGGMRIGAWNFRTMLDRDIVQRSERRFAIIDNELARYNLDLVALSKIKYHGTGQLQEESCTFYCSEKGKGKRI